MKVNPIAVGLQVWLVAAYLHTGHPAFMVLGVLALVLGSVDRKRGSR